MIRSVLVVLFTLLFAAPAFAQDSTATAQPDRSATGGAQTLDDILARQRGEKVDDKFRRDNTGASGEAADMARQLGILGGASDSELFRALRYGSADVTVSSKTPASEVLIQDGGMWWLEFRQGPLLKWGGYLLLGTLAFLGLFYLLRGRIRIDGEKAGHTILRFKAIERFGHWLLAGSFILLGITGLITLFGRIGLIPIVGHDAFATLASGSKWIHNNVSWAFMLGLALIFVLWVAKNIPDRTDIKWLAVGGGLFSKGVHPPAKKFNAGQKMIFWSVIVFGTSISLTGLSLLFPFEIPMFAGTFATLNDLGISAALGLGQLQTALLPHEEMQYAQLWHAIMAFVLMAIILAHIYIGSVGMEGAISAVTSGEVDEQWAKEHHSLWVDEVKTAASPNPRQTTPAE
ncbi:formate dehydrogenase subunit gamma [Coralliovum pocilloporae]|uniref:formate dehydrogenase subunit gamma n=1 Tax=Coralliovum pocilloporae TaxID=3066369 RepID=UPI003307932C